MLTKTLKLFSTIGLSLAISSAATASYYMDQEGTPLFKVINETGDDLKCVWVQYSYHCEMGDFEMAFVLAGIDKDSSYTKVVENLAFTRNDRTVSVHLVDICVRVSGNKLYNFSLRDRKQGAELKLVTVDGKIKLVKDQSKKGRIDGVRILVPDL